MSVRNPENFCYRHLSLVSKERVTSEDLDHKYGCNGLRGVDSSYPCDGFVSVHHVSQAHTYGIMDLDIIREALKDEKCAFEIFARIGRSNDYVKNNGKDCNSCDSNRDSGLSCDFYIQFKDLLDRTCAWQIRAERTKERLGEENLNSDERFCLGSCKGSLTCAACKNREGYYDCSHVVLGLCAHKARVIDKDKRRLVPEGLETICRSCNANSCNRSYHTVIVTATEFYHEHLVLGHPRVPVTTAA